MAYGALVETRHRGAGEPFAQPMEPRCRLERQWLRWQGVGGRGRIPRPYTHRLAMRYAQKEDNLEGGMAERPVATVLGLGLVGASLALALRRTGRYGAVAAWDPDFDT